MDSVPINIVAILEAVDLQTIPNFLRIAAPMLIVTLRMIKQAHSRAPVGLTTRLSSALEIVVDQEEGN
jgi:hypothetical protein